MTPVQRNALVFIHGFILKNGYSPTFRQIAVALGYESMSGSYAVVTKLIEDGYLRRSRVKARRSLEVIKLPQAAIPPEEATTPFPAVLSSEQVAQFNACWDKLLADPTKRHEFKFVPGETPRIDVEALKAELTRRFEAWFRESMVDFWSEQDAPAELAAIAVQTLG